MSPSTLLLESTESEEECCNCLGTQFVDNNRNRRSKHENENFQVLYSNATNKNLGERRRKSSHNDEQLVMEEYDVKHEIDEIREYEINYTADDQISLSCIENTGIKPQDFKIKDEPLDEDSFDEIVEISEIILESVICDDILQIKDEPDDNCPSTEYTADKFVCYHCNNEFNRKSNLRRHMMTTHEETVIKFWYCPNNCGRKYRFKHGMLQHMLYVCGKKKKFVCEHCKNRFSWKNTLLVHIRNTHMAVKSPGVESTSLWYCPHGCGRKYKQKFDLNRHVNSKCGKAKLFTCDYCWNGFVQKSSLKSHILNRHIIKKHKRFKCTNRCGRTYKYQRSLNYHLKYECGMPKRQFTCELCSKVFALKLSLNRHLKCVHNKIMVPAPRRKRS